MTSSNDWALSILSLRESSPLIHHITNAVTIRDCANVTLAIGGSPVMADSIDESSEMAGFAGALVLNMGTLHRDSVASMISAGKAAKSKKVPIVFDPVGAGATAFRRETALRIMNEVRPDIVKGNSAEIRFLAGESSRQRGVDSLETEEASEAVIAVARKYETVAAATGVRDWISDGQHLFCITGGTPWLGRITGAGCMTASLVGSFAAVVKSSLHAAALGILAMNVSGEKAETVLKKGEGAGRFSSNLLDAISLLGPHDLPWTERVKIAAI